MDEVAADLKKKWISEEKEAFCGWNFSYLDGRWESDPLPWDYGSIVRQHLKSGSVLLDMGTGGGEYLLTLGHTYSLTYVTESYPPNLKLCMDTLAPLGIHVSRVCSDSELPFENGFFDIVINRHESFDAGEVNRVLKPGGIFITQQVGGSNNKELTAFLLPEQQGSQFAAHTLENNIRSLKDAGLEIEYSAEYFPVLRFFDIGALVFFAKIIEWEFPGFTVERCFGRLLELQKAIENDSAVTSREHRFMITAKKLH
jgi:SAM-dependent methyltransferase